VQVLEYVPDATAALAEIHRALRPGGRLVVWDVDWATVSLHSSDPARTQRVLRTFDRHLAHPSLPQTLTARLRAAGFEEIGIQGHAFATNEFLPDAYGGSLVPLIEQYVAKQEGAKDEATAWLADQREPGQRGELFFACIQFCSTVTRSAQPRGRTPGRPCTPCATLTRRRLSSATTRRSACWSSPGSPPISWPSACPRCPPARSQLVGR
jgi:arsenite methyltransferase